MTKPRYSYIVLHNGHPQIWSEESKMLYDSPAGGNTQVSLDSWPSETHRSTNPAQVFSSYTVARRCIERTYDVVNPQFKPRNKFVIVRLIPSKGKRLR